MSKFDIFAGAERPTQIALDAACYKKIRHLLDTQPLSVIADPPSKMVSRFLSFLAYKAQFFGCIRCGEITDNAFSICPECCYLALEKIEWHTKKLHGKNEIG